MNRLSVTIDGHVFTVEIPPLNRATNEVSMIVDGQEVHVLMPEVGGPEPLDWIIVNGRPYELVIDRDLHWMRARSGLHQVEVRDLDATVARPASGDGRVKAPIPGLITRVLVAAGDHVEAGQPLLVLEAMKMENEVRAPRTGTITHLSAAAGQSVTLGALLAEIE
ncbi:MAG: biotin attachment protein [Chloroflexi bacterium]|nr:biotin attachment protein [Chloroflexota bacterium]